jgi:hypothetical protein
MNYLLSPLAKAGIHHHGGLRNASDAFEKAQ